MGDAKRNAVLVEVDAEQAEEIRRAMRQDAIRRDKAARAKKSASSPFNPIRGLPQSRES